MGIEKGEQQEEDCKEWLDDIMEWYNAETHELKRKVQEQRETWTKIVKHALDTNR